MRFSAHLQLPVYDIIQVDCNVEWDDRVYGSVKNNSLTRVNSLGGQKIAMNGLYLNHYSVKLSIWMCRVCKYAILLELIVTAAAAMLLLLSRV